MTFPKAVIFDMDGLLVDSSALWGTAEGGLLAARGVDYDDEARAMIAGLRMRDIVTAFKQYYNLPDDIESLRAELESRMLGLAVSLVFPKPGAAALLAYLKSQGIPCAVASSSPMVLINRVLESQQWESFFQVRCTGDDVPNGKPAPDVYLKAAHHLNTNPADCLALEDSVTGTRAATAAGMVCYAVPEKHTSPTVFDGITPYCFESLNQVLDALYKAFEVR